MVSLLEKVNLGSLSLFGFHDVGGYDIFCQNLPGIFFAGRIKLSYTSESSDNGVDGDTRTLFLHPLGKYGVSEW